MNELTVKCQRVLEDINLSANVHTILDLHQQMNTDIILSMNVTVNDIDFALKSNTINSYDLQFHLYDLLAKLKAPQQAHEDSLSIKGEMGLGVSESPHVLSEEPDYKFISESKMTPVDTLIWLGIIDHPRDINDSLRIKGRHARFISSISLIQVGESDETFDRWANSVEYEWDLSRSAQRRQFIKWLQE